MDLHCSFDALPDLCSVSLLQVQGALTAASSSRRLLAVNSSANTSTPIPTRLSSSDECDVPVSTKDETVVVETVVNTRVDQVIWPYASVSSLSLVSCLCISETNSMCADRCNVGKVERKGCERKASRQVSATRSHEVRRHDQLQHESSSKPCAFKFFCVGLHQFVDLGPDK